MSLRILAALVVASTGLAACALEPGSGSCVETTIELQPLTLTASQAPVELPARLVDDDGKPIAGADLVFGTRTTYFDRDGRERTSGRAVGKSTTNADGLATFISRPGLDGLMTLLDERLIGYSVEFRPVARIDGVQYCFGDAMTTIDVRPG